MSTLVGVQLSGAAILAAKKITKVQAQGEASHGPAGRTAKMVGEILEVELLRRFEQMFGMTVGEYIARKHARGKSCVATRLPLSQSISQADGFAQEDDGA